MTQRLHAVKLYEVPEARKYLKQGLSLVETAGRLNVLSRDLDDFLWSMIGVTDDEIMHRTRHYRPMF